jgi:TRAP-type C4-dicarboxylate transport system substrate-binding protein
MFPNKERRTEMKRALMRSLVLVVSVALGFGIPALAPAKEIELKAICFIPKNHPLVSQTIVWADRVNEAFKGKLKINYIGGPEIVPGLQQLEAVRKGKMVQVIFYPTAYYQSTLPEGVAFTLSRLAPWEERKSGGFYDFMVERHKKIGVMYIGRWLHSPFYLWSKKDVKSLEDLKGMKMRTTALYDRFMRRMGIVPVQISPADTYTGLERGTVEGFGWPLMGARDKGWTEVCKHIIDHPFYNQNTLVLMNLDSWNAIPKRIRKKMLKLTAEFEHDMVAHFEKAIAAEWKKLDAIGVKRIKFSPAEAKTYLDAAYGVEWEELKKKVPDLIPKLKKVTGN